MIAADSSSLIAHLSGDVVDDVAIVDRTLAGHLLVLPSVVLTELLSDPKPPQVVAEFLKMLPILEIGPDYWERAGLLSSKALSKGCEARLGDALIAQGCLDHDVP